MQTIVRYFRLYMCFLRFSFSKSLIFRLNFWFRIIMDLVYAFILIAFYKIIYAHTGMVAGWNQEQMLCFVGACLLIDSFQMTFCSDNLNSLAEKVNKGDLDYYLVRPVAALFILVLREISLNSFLNLLFSFGVFIYYLLPLLAGISITQLITFTLLLLNGSLLYCLTRLIFALPVFWLGQVRGLDTLFYQLYYCVDRPDRVFRGTARLLLTTIIPFCLMASFPSRILFEGNSWGVLTHCLLVSLFLIGLVNFIWRCGLRAYSSASS